MEALAIHIGGRQTINPHEVLSFKGDIKLTDGTVEKTSIRRRKGFDDLFGVIF